MTRMALCQALGDIDDGYILEARAQPRPIPFRRKLTAVLVAAIMAGLLMGAGLVAAVYGDSIQGYLRHYWNAVTRQEMDAEHLALLDNLSQEIGLNRTQGDVTVTVDSALVGNDAFFLLLRVTGLDFSKRHSYEFRTVSMEVDPSPAGALTAYGVQFQGIDGDGAALILMDYGYSAAAYRPGPQPFQVELTLENLGSSADGEILAEGRWAFRFALDRSQPIPVLQLPEKEFRVKALSVSGVLRELQVTATGIRFQVHYTAHHPAYMPHPKVVLKSGIVVSNQGGTGTVDEDGLTENYSFLWAVPIDIDEIAAIRIGDTTIEVAQ